MILVDSALERRETDGRPLQYRGVTIVDLDGDMISKLCTYYDSAQFTTAPAVTD